MIEFIRGRLVEFEGSSVIVEVGGVGLRLEIPSREASSLPPEGDEVTLYVREVFREEKVNLYGFLTREGREVFSLLLSVPSVGPQSALSIMSLYSPEEILRAVLTGDHGAFSAAPGVGKKTAQKIILELKDRVKKMALPFPEGGAVDGNEGEVRGDVLEALVALGFGRGDALRAFSSVQSRRDISSMDLDTIIKECLRVLWESKGKGR